MTTADGRRHRLWQDAAEAKDEVRGQGRAAEKGIDPKATKQTLGRYLDWWLADIVTPKLAPKTVKAYRDTVRLHLAPELGIELGKLTPQAVTSLLRKKERAGLSPRSVAMIREVLRGALNVAVKMQMVERNAAALAESPRQVKTERRMLTPTKRNVSLPWRADRLAALYRLALTLGMRQAEILGLRWQDVDLDEGTLRVRQTLQRIGKVIVIKEPKTAAAGARWHSPVTGHCARRAQGPAGVRAQAAGERWQETGLVFTSSVGTPLEPRNLTREFKRHLATAGLPKEWRFYDMRHAAASLLIADGIADHGGLGHARPRPDLDHAQHLRPCAAGCGSAHGRSNGAASGVNLRARWLTVGVNDGGRQGIAPLSATILSSLRAFSWSRPPDSNRRPAVYETAALPTELGRHVLHRIEPVSIVAGGFGSNNQTKRFRTTSATW